MFSRGTKAMALVNVSEASATQERLSKAFPKQLPAVYRFDTTGFLEAPGSLGVTPPGEPIVQARLVEAFVALLGARLDELDSCPMLHGAGFWSPIPPVIRPWQAQAGVGLVQMERESGFGWSATNHRVDEALKRFTASTDADY